MLRFFSVCFNPRPVLITRPRIGRGVLYICQEEGKITAETLLHAFKELGEAKNFSKTDVHEIIKHIGGSGVGDGVSYDQFRAMMNDHDDDLDDD